MSTEHHGTESRGGKREKPALVDPLLIQGFQIKAMFREFDLNKDGLISMQELHCKLSDMGMEEPMIEALMVMLDTDGDGEITLDEFAARYDSFQKKVDTAL